jgi:sugar lactone lactonase YvrE
LWGASAGHACAVLEAKEEIMKTTRLFSSLFVLTLCLVILASASFAKNLPLNFPAGLAVDASGNLYVANEDGQNILVYSSAYAQQRTKTITQGLNFPQGVAIDPYGNLWVSNNAGANVTEYTAGVQNTSNTITNGILFPSAIAIDGLDNLWVLNDSTDITIYSPTAVYAPPSKLVQTITPGGVIQGFTVGAGAFLFATSTQVFLESASATLLGNPLNGGAFNFSFEQEQLAPDNSGNIYVGPDSSHNVYIVRPNSTATVFVTLPSSVALVGGIAVDNVKKRVYISDFEGNQIFVYSTAGVLMHTIHN